MFITQSLHRPSNDWTLDKENEWKLCEMGFRKICKSGTELYMYVCMYVCMLQSVRQSVILSVCETYIIKVTAPSKDQSSFYVVNPSLRIDQNENELIKMSTGRPK